MISIIVPIYNAETYLPACIESVQAQTVNEWQLLLVDDGSTDGSLRIAKTYAAKDQRITVIAAQHGGQSAARNQGLEQATGEWIAFLDADDALESDWCAKHLEAAEGVGYVQSGYRRIQQSVVSSQKLPLHRWQFTSPCMRLYRRETIEGLRFEEGYIYEDVLFSVDLWLRNVPCRMIRYAGYRYTWNPSSTTSQPHPEARKALFRLLRARARKASLQGKMIIGYTILRLYIHFIIR